MRTTLQAGFTTVRELGGRDYHDVTLRNAQRSGLVQGPRMLATGPGVFPSGGLGYHLEPDAGVDSSEDAVKRVRQLVERGVDVIKIVSADGPEPLGQEWTIFPTAEEIQAVLAEATRTGRLKAAHAMCHDAIEVVTRAGDGHGGARLVPDRGELPHDDRARRLPDPDCEQHLGDHPPRPRRSGCRGRR